MKKLFFILVAILLADNALSQDLSVMTYNIRLATGKDAPYHWDARKDAAAYCLKKEKPDLLGVQEALQVQIDFLDSLLVGYKREGVGRDDGKQAGEYSAVYYDARKFERLDGGTFWLSETPDKVSMGWDAVCNRVVSWVKLKDLKSGGEFCYMNTHFDHKGKVARMSSSELIMKKMNELCAGVPVIISGDLNATEDDAPIKYLEESNVVFDSRKIAEKVIGEESTFHNFGKIKGGVIDYIFVTKGIDVKSSEIISYQHKGIYLSDHNPIIVKFKLKK